MLGGTEQHRVRIAGVQFGETASGTLQRLKRGASLKCIIDDLPL